MPKSKSTTAKQAPKKSSTAVVLAKEPTALRRYSFDIMAEGDDTTQIVQDTLLTIRSKRKNCTTSFKPMEEVQQSMLPIRDFFFQKLIGAYGICQSSILEIIGPAGVGKTTLTYQFAGWAMDAGCPVLRIGTEGKELNNERIYRTLSTDPTKARRMNDRLGFTACTSLKQMEEAVADWVDAYRGRLSTTGRRSVNVSIDTPLVVIVDSWSKLMSEGEAAGFSIYGDNLEAEKKKKFKETATGSNMGHAKFAHGWGRRAPEFLTVNNVIMIIVSHQNDKVDMGGAGSHMTAETAAIYNATKIGGKALNQNAGLQLILARKGLAKDGAGKPCGAIIRCRVHKNSFGPNNDIIEYELRDRCTQDSPTYIEPAIHTADSMAAWFATERILGTEASRKRYTCDQLGVTSASAEDFCAAFHANTEVLQKLGARLGIYGYSRAVDEAKKDLAAHLATTSTTVDQLPEGDLKKAGKAAGKLGTKVRKLADDNPPPPPDDELEADKLHGADPVEEAA